MRNATIVLLFAAVMGCDKEAPPSGASTNAQAPAANTQAQQPEAPAFNPPTDPKNIVNIAIGSADHTTLVAALKAADYASSVANPGPFTVFAPTNAAFAKLPAGTVDGLLKPDKQADLQNVLKYHVAVSVYQQKDFKDGQVLAMANGKKITLHVKDGKVMANDANIVASIPGSNGIVHVIDGVLLPPAPAP
jgi:uncharacterized surface protein with fasciclin (FAS1) repeats